jgi:hypothetical protein
MVLLCSTHVANALHLWDYYSSLMVLLLYTPLMALLDSNHGTTVLHSWCFCTPLKVLCKVLILLWWYSTPFMVLLYSKHSWFYSTLLMGLLYSSHGTWVIPPVILYSTHGNTSPFILPLLLPSIPNATVLQSWCYCIPLMVLMHSTHAAHVILHSWCYCTVLNSWSYCTPLMVQLYPLLTLLYFTSGATGLYSWCSCTLLIVLLYSIHCATVLHSWYYCTMFTELLYSI